MHIGKRIKEVLREQGHNVSWLAARIPCERSNVYNIFRRCNIDAGLLYSISLVMEYNFFADLSWDIVMPASPVIIRWKYRMRISHTHLINEEEI